MTTRSNRSSRVWHALLLPACFGALTACAPMESRDATALRTLAAAPHRMPRNVARDAHRHPLEVIRFLGIRPNSTVVEILPGSSGYYMEILAPWLNARGRYIAASRDPTAPARYLADHEKLIARLAADPAHYARVQVTQFNAGLHQVAPPGSADFVLTFRNLHNWVERGEIAGALAAFHRALKPGGILGVVDHRGRNDRTQEAQMKSGYVREDVAIQLIERAGFTLLAKSEVNANAKDRKNHPEGVWTLPPTYRLKDKDRARYAAIGESDRFTLKFVKR